MEQLQRPLVTVGAGAVQLGGRDQGDGAHRWLLQRGRRGGLGEPLEGGPAVAHQVGAETGGEGGLTGRGADPQPLDDPAQPRDVPRQAGQEGPLEVQGGREVVGQRRRL